MRRKKFWVICFPGPQYRPFLFFPQPGHLSPSCAAGDNGPRGSRGQPHATGELSKMRSLHSQCHACGLRSGQLVTVTSREHGSRLVRSIRFLPFIFFISNNLFCHHSIFNLDACLECISSLLDAAEFCWLERLDCGPLFSPPASLQQVSV